MKNIRVLLMYVVLLVGLIGLFVGSIDAATAMGTGRRIQGGFFLLSGLMAVVGAVEGIRGTRDACATALFGSVGAAFVAVPLAVAAWLSVDAPVGLKVMYFAASAASIAAALVIWTDCRVAPNIALGRISQVTALVSAGVLWGAFQFWYTTQYAPLQEPPNLSVGVDLDTSPAGERHRSVLVTTRIENTSTSKTLVLGSLYSVRAARLEDGHLDPSTKQIAQGFGSIMPAEVRLHRDTSNWSSIGFGPIVPVNSWLEPGQEWTSTHVFEVPVRSFQVVEVKAGIAVAHGNRIALSDIAGSSEVKKIGNQYEAAVTVWPVRPMSLFERWTRGDRELYSGVVISNAAAENLADEWFHPPNLLAFIEKSSFSFETETYDEGYQRRLSTQYGLSVLFAWSELPLGRTTK